MCSSRKTPLLGTRRVITVSGSFAAATDTGRRFRCNECTLVDNDVIHEERDTAFPGRINAATVGWHIVHCKPRDCWLSAQQSGCSMGAMSTPLSRAVTEVIYR